LILLAQLLALLSGCAQKKGVTMRLSREIACPFLLLLVAGSGSLSAQPKNPRDAQRSCREFVQRFYDRFRTRTPSKADKRVSDRQALSRQLRRLLEGNDAAEAKFAGDGLVGLDFDYLTGSQDLAERFLVGKIIPKERSFWVEVYDIWGGKKSMKPSVVPEVMFRNGRWIFVNFRYGTEKNNDLVSILKSSLTSHP
jgi:hypothetical protein